MKLKIHDLYRGKNKIFYLLLILNAIMGAILTYLTAVVLETMVDAVLLKDMHNAGHLVYSVVLLVVVGISYYGLSFLKNMFMNRENLRVMSRIFGFILEGPYDVISLKSSSDYFTAVTSDVKLATGYYQRIDEVLSRVATSVGASVYIFQMEPGIGAALFGLGIIIIIYNYGISPRFKKYQQDIQEDNQGVKNITMQIYKSYQDRRFYNFDGLDTKYEDIYTSYEKSQCKKALWRSKTAIFDYCIGFLQTYLPLLFMAMVFKGYTIGSTLAMISNTSNFMGIFRAMGGMIAGVKESMAGMERIWPMLQGTEGEERRTVVDLNPPLHIDISKMEYRYEGSPSPALSIDAFHIHEGQNIGLVGEKGSGKSTFIKILCGLLEGYQGSVEVNGHEVRDHSCSRGIAYLPQQFPVFDMSIMENFRVAAPELPEEEYWKMAAKVNMDQEIRSMPKGMNTRVNSNTISTGQRQRLSLCMALLRNTPIIVLDEPVSNLDTENIQIFQRLIQEEKEKTFIIVSHDLRIFDDSFKVYKIMNHSIVDYERIKCR